MMLHLMTQARPACTEAGPMRMRRMRMKVCLAISAMVMSGLSELPSVLNPYDEPAEALMAERLSSQSTGGPDLQAVHFYAALVIDIDVLLLGGCKELLVVQDCHIPDCFSHLQGIRNLALHSHEQLSACDIVPSTP